MLSDNFTSRFNQLDFENASWAPFATRIMHGRGKEFAGLEHVTIEWFPPHLVIFLHRPLDVASYASIKEYFCHFRCSSMQSISIQTRAEGKVFWDVLYGQLPAGPFMVREGDLQFLINLGGDQNVGLFLDTCPLREWLIHNAHQKRVLNLFSYTCSLSVAAAKGQALAVHNVDMKKNFLSWGRENHTLNNCDDNIFYHPLDVLKSFGRFKRLAPFDIIIVDPPSHQNSFILNRDYPRLLKRVTEWLSPNGTLVLAANDPQLLKEEFRQMVELALGASFQFMTWAAGPYIPLGKDDNFPLKVAFFNKRSVYENDRN